MNSLATFGVSNFIFDYTCGLLMLKHSYVLLLARNASCWLIVVEKYMHKIMKVISENGKRLYAENNNDCLDIVVHKIIFSHIPSPYQTLQTHVPSFFFRAHSWPNRRYSPSC
jgi:hypothetical protein